jgi:hypothetical protein
LHKTRVRFVAVEAADDVIAIGPRVVARFVLVVAMGFGIADGIEPVLSPFFSEGGRIEQSIDGR